MLQNKSLNRMKIIIQVLTNSCKFGLHGLNLCGVGERYMCKLIIGYNLIIKNLSCI